ncbi:MAG: glycosyltransferase family 4 protein [Actinobacteria bacterium]|nr:glycosyltransferase family 4 protein [Actinomycetota bacterium]
MRAAIFADQLFYRQPGGIGTYLRHLVPGIAASPSVDSLALVHHGPEGERAFQGLDKVEEVRLPWRRDLTGISWHTVGRPYLERCVGRVDLVHAPSLVYPPSRASLVATVHDLCVLKYPWVFPTRWRAFHRRGLHMIVRRARVILVDSENTREDLRALTGGRDPRVRVVPLGVEVRFDPDDDEVEKVLGKHRLEPGYILYVGTIEPRKNLSRLARAYATFGAEERRRCGELVLVGSPGWMGRRELSGILSLGGVRWLGYLPQEELEAVYRGARIFVYPSIYEGFGLPVLEAMARGLPVVTSNSSSLREVGEGVALLVDPGDVMDIGRAIRRLADDEGMRNELALLGRKRAAAYRWERTIELTLEAYKDALV